MTAGRSRAGSGAFCAHELGAEAATKGRRVPADPDAVNSPCPAKAAINAPTRTPPDSPNTLDQIDTARLKHEGAAQPTTLKTTNKARHNETGCDSADERRHSQQIREITRTFAHRIEQTVVAALSET